ncbi:MAG: tetratricopeptide repeat protein [Chloroflexi bacterium]|nr:tetratricopeptide repeat protein [Chloroflexota bacterium]
MEPLGTFKPREIEILQLMADGQSNREIADRLFIGVETVRWYAKQIYSKLDVPGRDEAADKARELGLLALKTGEYPQVQPRHMLPAQLTSFIGREREIEEVAALLHDSRLLTLTGPGGTGKTRLGIRFASQHADRFPDGTCFVDLAAITDPTMVAPAIAQALGVADCCDQPMIETLQQAISLRKMLLILDNFEQVIDAAVVVRELLAGTEHPRILVTSREALRVSGEQVYPVPPLSLADNGGEPESVALFVQRAQAVKPNFHLDPFTRETVADICRQLDGMPLAIELAATLSRFLTPEAILARLAQRLDTLKGGARDAPARQQTLRKTIDWSYNLLSPAEKALFARLSVFRGGRSLGAIEAVCGDGLDSDVLDTLAALVDKNMIRQAEDFNGEPRFFMLETIQAYARERLDDSGDAVDVQRRHAAYVAELVERAQPFLRQREGEYWYPRLSVEHDNIRTALAWALSGGDAGIGARIVGALRDFWFYEGFHVEGLHWAHQALEHLDDVDASVGATVLMTAGSMSAGRQDSAQGREFYGRAVEQARESGDRHIAAWALMFHAMSTYDAAPGDRNAYQTALTLCKESLSLVEALDDQPGIAQALNILANIYHAHGEYTLAKDTYEACLRIVLKTGERRRETMSYANLAEVAYDLEEYDRAQRLAYAALQLAWQVGFRYMTVLQLGYTVPAALVGIGRPHSAARALGASIAKQESLNIRHQPNYSMQVEPVVTRVRSSLSEAEFRAEYEAGRALSLEDAVAFALDELKRLGKERLE